MNGRLRSQKKIYFGQRGFKGNEIMIEIRKIITMRETVFSELGVEANRPITRAAGLAVIRTICRAVCRGFETAIRGRGDAR